MKTTFPTLLALGFFTATWIVFPNTLFAVTRVKAYNADDLNLTSSWTNAIVPGGTDVAQFDATVTGPLTLALGADTAWSQFNFVNPGGEITIDAGDTLTLSNNTPIIFGAATTNLTLNCDVNFAGAAFSSVRSPAGQTLTFGGVIDGRDVAVTLGNTAGTILLGSPNTVRIGSVVQVNTTGMHLGLGASSVGDPVTSGPLGTNLFTWATSAATSELFTYNGNQTLGNPVRLTATSLNFNSAYDLTLTGVADMNNGNRILNIASNGVLRFTGTISNASGLTKTGGGLLELGGTNVSVWNNGLTIYGGTVRLLNDDVIPDGGSAGTVRMTNSTEVLDMNGFSDTIRGLASPVGLGIWGGTLDNTAPGTTSVLTLGDQFTYTLAGSIQNSGLNSRLALVKIGTGGLYLTNANTFSGGITNDSNSEIYLNSPGAAGTGPIVLAQPISELVYSGGGSITWTNDIILAAGTGPVISAADGSTLEIASIISGPGTFMRTNTLGQRGVLNFSGDNTFTGGFVLFGGSVVLSHPRAAGLGLLTIGNSDFASGSIYLVPGINLSGANAITNEVLINRDFTIGGANAIEFAGPVVWITNAIQRSINVTNPAGIVISGPMSGYGFNKVGAGLLTLNSVCSHNGPTTISVGPMAIGPGGSFTGATTILLGAGTLLDVSAASSFAIAPTQTLTGSGASVKGKVTINGALTLNSLFSSFYFSNNLALASGSTTSMNISRNFQTVTRAICYGALSYGGDLVVNNIGSTLVAGDTFPLFGFTGAPGNFDNLTLPSLDAGLTWDTSKLPVDGTISVIVSGPSAPQLSNPQLLNPSNFVIAVTGGTTNGQFRVLTQTNVAEPVANWVTLSTNTFDGIGALTVTNLVNPAEPQRFFRIVAP
jgi:fibronectin-binding autotransporter adhesin